MSVQLYPCSHTDKGKVVFLVSHAGEPSSGWNSHQTPWVTAGACFQKSLCCVHAVWEERMTNKLSVSSLAHTYTNTTVTDEELKCYFKDSVVTLCHTTEPRVHFTPLQKLYQYIVCACVAQACKGNSEFIRNTCKSWLTCAGAKVNYESDHSFMGFSLAQTHACTHASRHAYTHTYTHTVYTCRCCNS